MMMKPRSHQHHCGFLLRTRLKGGNPCHRTDELGDCIEKCFETTENIFDHNECLNGSDDLPGCFEKYPPSGCR